MAPMCGGADITDRQKWLYRYWRRATIPAHIAIDLARVEVEPSTGDPAVDYLIHLHDGADA
ncbi:hypothetical protein WL21_18765 [Burkholderia ubonensis]|nr:hypothetical protein WJ81_16685 [Burkholderia ubonensis]KVZ66463.1 hypothetical protein WL21_18765 [Burkholderia ubonensis]KVZ70114.1 hypothetical protein WL20_04965 [Burkholderia ubonensis]